MANDINRHRSLKNRDWQIACNEIKNKLQGEKNFFKPQFLVFAQSVVVSLTCTKTARWNFHSFRRHWYNR